MAPSRRPRPIVFIAVSALLVLSGIVFSRSESGGEVEEGSGRLAESPTLVAQRVEAETARLNAEVERSAERFLTAFLRYEVGDIDSDVRRELRATSTAELGAALLATPPHLPPGGGYPARARLQGLEVAFADGAFSAFVDATAVRGEGPERLSFEFEFVEGEWLAGGFTQ